jgi:hypothetical protein
MVWQCKKCVTLTNSWGGGKKENDGRGGFNYVILEELL